MIQGVFELTLSKDISERPQHVFMILSNFITLLQYHYFLKNGWGRFTM